MTPPLLLIEDMPSLRMVYEAVLRKAQFEVTSAGTAAEGLSKFQSDQPNVVLLDLRLPDRCGLKLMADMLALAPDVGSLSLLRMGRLTKQLKQCAAVHLNFWSSHSMKTA
ncbi:MAG: two-component system repressor protein LuxO [Paracoccaceae bacterium]|jgi:two-component system repressor protein LuxO